MKIKLKNTGELRAIYEVVSAMSATIAAEATRPAAAGERPHVRMAARLVAVEVQRLALAIAGKLVMPAAKPSLALGPSAGLALLSAWYAVDSTEIQDPLAYSLMVQITDALERAYGGQTIKQ